MQAPGNRWESSPTLGIKMVRNGTNRTVDDLLLLPSTVILQRLFGLLWRCTAARIPVALKITLTDVFTSCGEWKAIQYSLPHFLCSQSRQFSLAHAFTLGN